MARRRLVAKARQEPQAEQQTSARKMAKAWVDAMKEHRMSALAVNCQVGVTDAGGFLLGYIREALDQSDYAIEHMGWSVVGQAPNGVPLCLVSMLIVSKTGKAQSVILG